ncbi:MAG: SpoIIE family protein phosphatase [Bacteroidales bacterium]|nr:SpoIIE family protein phosphatase [Bacteroidales bacterium]
MTKIKLIALIICTLHMLVLWSQTITRPPIKFEHYSVDDGLSQSSVNYIFQDKKGFLWFATQDGLNKFDGYTFTVYQHNPLDTNSISSNWIYGIDEDDLGFIWVATQNGVNRLNPKTGKFKHYYLTNNKNETTEEVYRILAGNNGDVWYITAKTLFKLDTTTGIVSRFEHEIDYFVSNKTDKGYPMLDDGEGIWIGSASGLFYFIKKLEVFKPFKNIPGDNNTISNNYITGLAFDDKGYLWIATRYGLNKYDRKKNKFTHYFVDEKNTNNGPSNNIISDVCWSKKGLLWIATFGGGLNAYDPSNNVFYHYKKDEGTENSLYSNYLLSLYEDRSLNLWIGLDADGLEKGDLKPQKFQIIRSSKTKDGLHLTSNAIGSIYLENDSILWIGTWENGLNIVNRNTNQTKVVSTNSTPDRIIGNNIHAILKDSRGLIWIGTRNGISIFDNKTKKFYDADNFFKTDINSKFNDLRIYDLKEDFKGNIWISTKNGLFRYNYDSKTINSFFFNEDDSLSLYDNTVLVTLCDKNGFVWIGTKSGLNRFDYNTNKFFRIAYKKSFIPQKNLRIYQAPSNPYIYHLCEDLFDENILWIGTGSGLNKFYKQTQTFEIYTIEDGLPNGTIYELIQDKNGNLWMSTNRGIAFFNTQTKKFISYNTDDGLQGLEFNNGASFIAPNGEIFFGGINGITVINPSQQKLNIFLPNVVFTTLEKIDGHGKKQVYNITDEKVIELNYNDHSIIFHFAALEYTKPQNNNFAYMLEGITNTWVSIENKNMLEIGVLSPGEYKLLIKGSNNDGVWNEEPTAITIIVHPPFYKTIYAYILYGLILISIVYWYVRSRSKKLKAANEALREKQLSALEIARQKEELSIKNKNITDSINYAKRIQEALLPSEYLFRKLLPDSFILYKPRDIVSGDFYWVTEKESKIFVAAVDCTGHGVPGAFMSIIGYDLLKNITREQNIEDPAEILNLLNLGVSDTFSKQSYNDEIKDGMDMGLLVIDRINKQLQYAGAFNPLYIIRNKQLIEIKGNRFSIGKMEGNEHKKFDLHTLEYENNDMLYLFSDGYADQIGGPMQKKFKFRRFQHLLLSIHSLPLNKQKDFLNETFETWKGEMEQVDDILIIGIRL